MARTLRVKQKKVVFPSPEQAGQGALLFYAVEEGEFVGMRFSPEGVSNHPFIIDIGEIYKDMEKKELLPPRDSNFPVYEEGEAKSMEEILSSLTSALKPVPGFPAAAELYMAAQKIRQERKAAKELKRQKTNPETEALRTENQELKERLDRLEALMSSNGANAPKKGNR